MTEPRYLVSPVRTPDGDWGVMAPEEAREGDYVQVRTRFGKTWTTHLHEWQEDTKWGVIWTTRRRD